MSFESLEYAESNMKIWKLPTISNYPKFDSKALGFSKIIV